MFKRRGLHSKKKANEDEPAAVTVPENLDLSSDSEVEASDEEEEGFSGK